MTTTNYEVSKKALENRRLKLLTGFIINQTVYGRLTGQAFVVMGLGKKGDLMLQKAGSKHLFRHAIHTMFTTVPPKSTK